MLSSSQRLFQRKEERLRKEVFRDMAYSYAEIGNNDAIEYYRREGASDKVPFY